MHKPLRVAVLGAGLIGIDLVAKIKRSPALECGLVAARDSHSSGLRSASALGCPTSADGITAVLAVEPSFDVVFDATNATAHGEHANLLREPGSFLIDLTPSRVGHMVVPTVNGRDVASHRDVSLISCGGQASIPVLYALARRYQPRYIEVVTTAASRSVGRATRLNLDEYIQTTADAVRAFTGTDEVKVMVNVSPARPAATFRVAMSLVAPGADQRTVRSLVDEAAEDVRSFAPGFRVTTCSVTDDLIFVAVEVASAGDKIPRYAGNLDIINSAAVLIAERYGAQRQALEGAHAR